MFIIPQDHYTLDASAQTITLSYPYNTLTVEKLVKITDLDTDDVLYDSDIKRGEITYSDGVITYQSDNNIESDTDSIQIIIDEIPLLEKINVISDSLQNHLTKRGEYFRNGQKFDILDGGEDYIYFTTGSKSVHMRLNAKVDGDTEIQLYEDTTVSDTGTQFISGNFNFNSTEISETEWFYSPTITDDGSYKAFTWAFGGSGSNPSRSVKTSSSIDGVEVISEPNKSYMIKLINHASRDLQVFFEVDYYECDETTI